MEHWAKVKLTAYSDVLNRFPLQRRGTENEKNADQNVKHEESTIRVMMYMFPRQFGLHNVFTSQVDHTQTAQKFQDYTL
jgi:telomerase reverse transcriptase